jgi:hypothetical protein
MSNGELMRSAKKIAQINGCPWMFPDIEKELQWKGPMEELPPNLGWVHLIGDVYPA